MDSPSVTRPSVTTQLADPPSSWHSPGAPLAGTNGPTARMANRLVQGIRTLIQRAIAEHATPREVALSVAIGTFCACTPLIGLHLWLALGLATLFRLNRLWAAVGSRATSIPPLLPLAVFAEVQLAHRVRTGGWVPLSPHEALAHGGELVLDWVLGTPFVGATYATLLGLVAYGIARVRLSRATAVNLRTPDAHRPASLESRTSERPNPMQ